jgi:uncharacterized protein
MKKITLIYLLLFSVIISTVDAQTQSPRCNQADAELNQIYQKLRASLNDQEKNELKKKQREWLSSRSVVVTGSQDKEASFYQVTAERVAYLEKALQQSKGPDRAVTSTQITDRLVGTWSCYSHRHPTSITFHANGTYERESENERPDFNYDQSRIKGIWKCEGDGLFEIPEGKGSGEPSKIVFDGADSFTLDGFQTYKRVQQSEDSSQNALAECVKKTQAIMDQKIPQNDPTIQRLCTKRFKALLRKGFHTTADDPMGFFDSDVRYDTQDDYPRIVQMGPAICEGNGISVPVELQFRTNPPFTKTWVYLKENGQWLADDMLTQKEGESDRTSLADELTKCKPSGGSKTEQ